MKKVVILAADDAMASQVTGLMDFFMICNRYWQVRNNDPHVALFDVRVVSPHGQQLNAHSGVIIPALSVEQISEPDAVILSGGISYNEETLREYYDKMSPLIPYVKHWQNTEVPICSFCSSTFLLAEMGLLEQRKATSVWWLATLFERLYPNVSLQLGQLVVQDDNLFTAGATTAYFSLCLLLVEHLYDAHLAAQIAKLMLIEPNRSSQLPHMTLQTFERHNDSMVLNVQKWMYQNLKQPITLDILADKFATTKRTLNRRFKKALNDTPVNYLQKMRVEAAKRLLESSDMPIERVVNEVGYEDTSSFRKLFAEVAELSPKAYRDKFRQGFGVVPDATITY